MLSFNCTVTYKNSPYKTVGIIIDQYGTRNSDGSKLSPGQHKSLKSVKGIANLLEFLSDGYYDNGFDKDVTDVIFALTIMDDDMASISTYDFNKHGQYIGALKVVPKVPQEFFEAFEFEVEMQASGTSSYLMYEDDAVQKTIANVISASEEPPNLVELVEEDSQQGEIVVADEVETVIEVSEPEIAKEEPEDQEETAQEAAAVVKKTRAPKKARHSTKDIKEDKNESTEIGEQQ
jgi:hypothetical protein